MNMVLVIKYLKYLHLEDGEREVGYYIIYLTHISQFLTNLYDITKSQLRYNNMDELIRCSAIFSPLSIQSFIHPSIHSSVQTASNLSITLPAFFSVPWNNWHAHVWKWLNLWQKSMNFQEQIFAFQTIVNWIYFQHAPFDGMVIVSIIYYIDLQVQRSKGKWQVC